MSKPLTYKERQAVWSPVQDLDFELSALMKRRSMPAWVLDLSRAIDAAQKAMGKEFGVEEDDMSSQAQEPPHGDA